MPVTSLNATLAAVGYAKVIVALKASAAAAPAAAMASVEPRAIRPRLDRQSVEAALQKYFIVPDEAQTASLAAAATRSASRSFRRREPLSQKRIRVYPRLGLAVGYVDPNGAAALSADPNVADVNEAPELSLIRPVAAAPAKLAATHTWGIERLGAERLWAAGITGKGALIGHLDTGVDATHRALQDAIAAFAEFDLAGDQVPNAMPSDSGEHGTHTAGTIAGRAVGNRVFGVAPEAKLASAMVIEGGQVIDRILGGMEWVIAQNCRVLSMSLGLRGFTDAFQTVIDALRAADVLPVIAVGNEGPATSRSPGNYVNVLSIGAADSSDRVADFSGSQTFNRPGDPLVPDLVAPGVDVPVLRPWQRLCRDERLVDGDTACGWPRSTSS